MADLEAIEGQMMQFLKFLLCAVFVLGFSAKTYAAYNGSTFAAPSAAAIENPYPQLPYVTPEMYGAVGGGVTDDTTHIQAFVTACVTNGWQCLLDNVYKIGEIDFAGDLRLKGSTVNAGFVLTGANAGLVRTASANILFLEDFNIAGDNTLADNQYGLRRTTGTLVEAVIRNVNVSATTVGMDFTDTTNVQGYGGVICPCIGITSGHGYGIVTGTPNSNARSISWTNLTVNAAHRHGFYGSNGGNISLTNFTCLNHRTGDTPATLPCLQLSRGVNFTATNLNFINCADAPFGMDDDDSTGAASVNFVVHGLNVYNCPVQGFIGFDGDQVSTTLTTNVYIDGLNWTAPANSTGTCIDVFWASMVELRGQCDFSAGNTAGVTAVQIRGSNNLGPYNVRIDMKGKGVTSGPNNTLVYVFPDGSATASDGTVRVTGDSYWDGGTLITGGAPIQNSGIRTTSLQDTLGIDGATPYVSAANIFTLTQTGSTNLTNFLGGYNGQIIHIIPGDGNTTFKDSSSIRNLSGTDLVSVANVAVVYMNHGGVWYQQ